MKTKLSLLLALALAVSPLAGCGQTAGVTSDTPAPDGAALSAAKDYAEIYATLTASRSNAIDTGTNARAAADLAVEAVEEEIAMDTPAEAPMPSANDSAASNSAGWSGTNVQVQGIDEGDIVKTDGTYIYVLNRAPVSDEGQRDDILTIVRAGGADSTVVSQTRIGWSHWESDDDSDRYSGFSSESKRPREMFVSDGALVVLSDYNSAKGWYEDGAGEWRYESEQYLCVDFYDVSAPAAPRLVSTLGQDGTLTGSRLQDGKLYIVSTYRVWDFAEDEPITYVPGIYRNGEARALPADCIYICGESTEYVVVCSYDLAGGALDRSRSLLGSGSRLYMSGPSLYVLGSTWLSEVTAEYTESVYSVKEYLNSSTTEIYRFDLSGGGLTLAANGSVPGYIESQFSADEKDGYLRIVTTYDSSSYTIYEDEAMGFTNYRWPDEQSPSSNGLYVLDAGLSVVGSLTGLAESEYVYSVRYDGDVAYFCTYRNVDPLFTVDLSDPANPTVLSALKITGFSEYLHGWTENRLFGFGYEADEDTGHTEGLKLVMFDTSDKTDVIAAHTWALKDVYYSEALYNHKAFFIDPAKNIIGFVGNDSEYFVFSYDENAGFTELCRFTFDTYEYNVRGLWIGDTAYIVGQEEMMTVGMDTWTDITGINISG